MPKGFVYFLVIAQTILTVLHLLIYQVLLLFFPALRQYHSILLILLLLLSVSFLGLTILSHSRENFLISWANIFSSIWMVLALYFTLASAICLIIFLVLGGNVTIYGIVAVSLSTLLSLYGLINARVTRVVELKIKLPNLPDFWKNKTAVMVSDLHLGQILKNGFAKKIVKLINAQNPEIVFIPGDFYDGVHSDFAGLANEFSGKKITAPLGVYFCSGNHEMFASYQDCEKAVLGAGINILENQKVEIHGLQIAGVAYKKETMADLPQTLTLLGLDSSKPSVLLKHVPNQIQEVAQAGVNLMLAGHSHQGQIWPGRHITKKVWKGFDYGLKSFGQLLVYTSSGAGTWGPPMRVFTKSEIVKIIFE